MNSEETEITLKVKVNYGWDENLIDGEDALHHAIGLAINPDFTETVEGTYLNCVTVMDDDDNVIAIF